VQFRKNVLHENVAFTCDPPLLPVTLCCWAASTSCKPFCIMVLLLPTVMIIQMTSSSSSSLIFLIFIGEFSVFSDE
jgi:hypothetical protein